MVLIKLCAKVSNPIVCFKMNVTSTLVSLLLELYSHSLNL